MKYDKPNPKDKPQVFVWLDATSEHGKEIRKLEHIEDTRGLMAIKYTCGWLIKEDRHGIIVAGELCIEDEKLTEIDHTTIPKKMLIEVRE